MKLDNGRFIDYAIAIVSLLVFSFLFFSPPHTTLLEPDSEGYLSFSPRRGIGYPLFLDLFTEFFKWPVEYVPYGQTLIFLASAGFLSVVFYKASKNLLLTFGLYLSVILNPFLLQYNFKILTESLSVSLLNFFLGFLILFLQQPQIMRAIFLSITAGLSIMVRPVSWFLLPLNLIVFFWPLQSQMPFRKTSLAVALILPFAFLVLVQWAVKISFHQGENPSLLSMLMFGKSVMIEAKIANPYSAKDPLHDLWNRFEEMEPVRVAAEQEKNLFLKKILVGNYEVFFEYRFAKKELERAAAERNISLDDVRFQFAMKRIWQNPWAFIRITTEDFVYMWIPFSGSLVFSDELQKKSEGYLKLPYGQEALSDYMGYNPFPAILAMPALAVLLITGLVSWVLSVIAFKIILMRQQALVPVSLACLSALAINGNFLLVALTGIPTGRYSMALWPSMMVMIFSILVEGYQRWQEKR